MRNLELIRTYFTSYCHEKNIESDTYECDTLMGIMWEECENVFDGDFNDFYNYMVEEIV